MDRREDLVLRIAEHESLMHTAERNAERAKGRVENIELAIGQLARREAKLLIELDAATHPDTLYRDKKVEDIAVELAGVQQGITALESLQRKTGRDLEMILHDVRSHKNEQALRRDDLAVLDAGQGSKP